MQSRLQNPFFVLIVSLLALGVMMSACAPVFEARPMVDVQAEINTAVAATLVQYIIETKVAFQASGLVVEPAAPQVQVAASATPIPTASLTLIEAAPPPTATLPPPPTQPPAPTAVVYPKIVAEQNTNCRLGPSTRYAIDGYLAAGASSTVYGRDSGRDWWYISHPFKSGQFCWVWDGSTIVDGNTVNLPVVEAPALLNTNASKIYGYQPYDSCNPYGFTNIYCGGFVNGVLYPKCKPKNVFCCDPDLGWFCAPNIYCECSLVWQNPCKKNGCPPVTIVNFDTYCKKYPKCCK